jgi:hypothetical protein
MVFSVMGQAPAAIAFAVTGPIARDDLPGLCARVCALLDDNRGAELAYCDVRDVHVTAATVDALARLQLAARHYGCRIQLRLDRAVFTRLYIRVTAALHAGERLLQAGPNG